MAAFIGFIEKTWFLWWILAILAILRWFNAVAVQAGETDDHETSASADAPPAMDLRHKSVA